MHAGVTTYCTPPRCITKVQATGSLFPENCGGGKKVLPPLQTAETRYSSSQACYMYVLSPGLLWRYMYMHFTCMWNSQIESATPMRYMSVSLYLLLMNDECYVGSQYTYMPDALSDPLRRRGANACLFWVWDKQLHIFVCRFRTTYTFLKWPVKVA